MCPKSQNLISDPKPQMSTKAIRFTSVREFRNLQNPIYFRSLSTLDINSALPFIYASSFLCPLYYNVNCSTSCFFRLSISLLTTFLNRITFTRTLSSSFLHLFLRQYDIHLLNISHYPRISLSNSTNLFLMIIFSPVFNPKMS